MIKWFIIILLGIPRVIYSTIKLKIMNRNKEKYDLNSRYQVVRNTVIWVSRFTKRRLNIVNKEILKTSRDHGRLYVSNHFNVYEAMAFIESSEKPLIFVSKKENLKTPFLACHAVAIDTLFIDRDDVRQSLKVCKEAGKLVKAGNDVVIFAEGTRSKDGNVAPFKAALPTIVHYSESETVLVCMHHSEKPLKWRWISYPKENVNIKFFDPLPYSFYLENRKSFNELTRNMIQSQLEEFRKEFD